MQKSACIAERSTKVTGKLLFMFTLYLILQSLLDTEYVTADVSAVSVTMTLSKKYFL